MGIPLRKLQEQWDVPVPDGLDVDRWTVHSMGWIRTDKTAIRSTDDGQWRVTRRPPQGDGWELDERLPGGQFNGAAEFALWVDENYPL